jgi:hypothetical protein
VASIVGQLRADSVLPSMDSGARGIA